MVYKRDQASEDRHANTPVLASVDQIKLRFGERAALAVETIIMRSGDLLRDAAGVLREMGVIQG